MIYAEKAAKEILNMLQTLTRPSLRLLTDAVKKIMQQQQQRDLHLFQETLKEHGIGGLQYDAIIERVKEAIMERE